MKDDIKRAYSKVSMSEADKLVVLNNIKTRTKRRNTRYIAWAAAAVVAAAAIVVAFALGGALPNESNKVEIAAEQPEETISQTPMCTAKPSPVFAVITLSINPSVEFRIDEEGFVIEVVGTNGDGIALVEGLDASGLSLENATILVVNRLIENGYITASAIDKEITLTIDNGAYEIDTLGVMSSVIKTAASAYEIDVDVIEVQDQNGVNIVLSGTDEENGTGGEEPVDSSNAKVMPPDTTKRVELHYEFGAVGWLKVYDDNGELLPSPVDTAGMPTKEAVLWCLNWLIDCGYITDKENVLIDLWLSNPTEKNLDEAYTMTKMLIEEARLVLTVKKRETGVYISRDDLGRPPREAEYTMCEIMDVMFIKDRNKVTQQQMEILRCVYTEEEIDFWLMPRYFIIMPDLVGLTEKKAVELIDEVGMKPEVVYSYEPSFDGKVGIVTIQDLGAGATWEVGQRCGICVQTERPEDYRIVRSYVPVDMSIEDYETYLIENDLVQAHLDLENMGTPPAMMEEEYGPISQIEYDLYNEAIEKIGVELKYLLPWEQDEYFRDEDTGTAGCNGYPTPIPTDTIED